MLLTALRVNALFDFFSNSQSSVARLPPPAPSLEPNALPLTEVKPFPLHIGPYFFSYSPLPEGLKVH